jgi:hypothetical protein
MTVSTVQQLITDARVPGLSTAVVGDRLSTAITAIGVRSSHDRAAVDQQTIFAPAFSWLGYPVFSDQ